MADLLANLSEKNRSLLLMAVLKDGDRAGQLLGLLPESRGRELQAPLEELLKIPKSQRKEELSRALERLLPERRESFLQHADAGWIVESFRDESPLVLFLLLRELPKNTVGRFLSELSKETRKALKSVKPKDLPPDLMAWLRRRIRRSFPAMPEPAQRNEDPFGQLRDLHAKQLIQLAREVGLQEMAIAFSKVDRTATRAILHRLSLEDAKELRKRIKQNVVYSLELQREAQLNILDMDIEKSKTGELASEIGFSVLSRAFCKSDLSLAQAFIYRLPTKQGYVFKRYLDLNVGNTTPEKAQKVRLRILDAFMNLHG